MKLSMLVCALVFGLSVTAWADGNYCGQLVNSGLEGKLVGVNSADGGERNFTHGNVAQVTAEMLVIELGGSRSYINCSQIHSVVVSENSDKSKASE